jgi:hypothetical protein
MTMETFPAEGVSNPAAYLDAIQQFQPGDAATIFTPGMWGASLEPSVLPVWTD